MNLGTGGDTAATVDLSVVGAAPSTGKTGTTVLYASANNTAAPLPVSGVNPLPVYSGANVATPVAAGTTTAVTICKNAAGRIGRVIVIATGTAAVSIYDNASTASGTILLTIPANAATGTIYDVGMPAANGVTVGQVNNSPALLVGTF